MAIFDIEDPVTGQKLTLEGDAPPDEAALDEIFAQTRGARDAVSAKPATPEQPGRNLSTTDLIIDLVRRIPGVDAADKSLQGVKDLSKGAVEGFQGAPDTAQPASPEQKLGRGIGKYGPAAAGSALLTAATGGTAALPLIGAAALGAGGGEAWRQLGARATGGEQLSSGEAATKIGRTGVEAAIAETGIRVPIAVAKTMLPVVSQTLLRVPAESIKRALANPKIIPWGGNAAQESVERAAVASLKRVQTMFRTARQMAGKSMEASLNSLYATTKGAKVFNLKPAVDEAMFILKEAGAENPAVQEALKRELRAINPLLAKMTQQGSVSAKDLVALRKSIDTLADYSKGGAPVIQSEVGQRALKALNAKLREGIIEVANKAGNTQVAAKIAEAAKTINAYEDVRGLIATTSQADDAVLSKLNILTRRFNDGGLRTSIVNNIGNDLPPAFRNHVIKEAEQLSDLMAARAFTHLPQGTPSGIIKDFFRIVGSPANVGRAIKGASKTPTNVVRGAGIAAQEESRSFLMGGDK